MELISITLAGIYLVVMAVVDKRKKEIPVEPGVICIVFIVLAQMFAGKKVIEWAPGVLVGIFIFLVSCISRESIGRGDALVYAVTGLALGFSRNIELLLISLLFSSFSGLWLLIVKRKGRRYKMAFIPFTMIAYGVVVFI